MENTKSKTKFLQRLTFEERHRLIENITCRFNNVFSSEINDERLYATTTAPYFQRTISISIKTDDFRVKYFYEDERKVSLEREQKELFLFMAEKFGEEYVSEAKSAIKKDYAQKHTELEEQMNKELSFLSNISKSTHTPNKDRTGKDN